MGNKDLKTRLPSCAAAIVMLAMAAPSGACAPPSIQFGLGSARVGARDRWAIDETVEAFRARRGVRVRLRAQTDGLGPADANMRLAHRRGEAVKAALVRRGIPASAIDIIAVGESSNAAAPESRIVWLHLVAEPNRDEAGQTATC